MGTGGADGDYLNFDNNAYQRNLLPMQRPMPSNSLEGGGLHDEDGDEHSNASDGCLSKATSHSSWNANDSREDSERGGDDEDTSEEDDGDEARLSDGPGFQGSDYDGCLHRALIRLVGHGLQGGLFKFAGGQVDGSSVTRSSVAVC